MQISSYQYYKIIYKVTKTSFINLLLYEIDARFKKIFAQFMNLAQKTMHQINENIEIRDLNALKNIYEEIILTYNDFYS